jgi:hypothetical protein
MDIVIPVNFYWNSSLNAISYELQISKSQDFAQMEFEEAGINNNYKQVTSLQNGTKYYWRVRSSNTNGTSGWSEIWTLTTAQNIIKPTIVTAVVNNITQTTAIVGGEVTSDGGSTITENGVYFGTSQNPESTGTKYQIGSGSGLFSTTLTGLNPNTTYYV